MIAVALTCMSCGDNIEVSVVRIDGGTSPVDSGVPDVQVDDAATIPHVECRISTAGRTQLNVPVSIMLDCDPPAHAFGSIQVLTVDGEFLLRTTFSSACPGSDSIGFHDSAPLGQPTGELLSPVAMPCTLTP